MNPDRIEYYYRKYRHRVHAYAYKLLEMKDSAWVYGQYEDVVQDVFMSLKDLDEDQSKNILSWLFQAVRFRCFKLLRKDKVNRRHHEIIYNQSEVYCNAVSIHAEVVADIIKQVELLPVAQRIVFKMRYIDEMKQSQIAKQLKISVQTVNVHLYKAKQRIRSVFKDKEI